MIETAVIIAGGAGTRLKPLTDNLPKAMAPINGKPIIYWVVQWLKANGIRKLVFGVAYKKEKIMEYVAEMDGFGLEVCFSEHTTEGGTAEAFRLAITRHVTDEDFLGMNCDELCNLNLEAMAALHQEKSPLVTMALAPFHCRFSMVDVSGDGVINGFKYGYVLEEIPISIGIYIFNSGIVERIPESGSIEDLVFAPLAQEGKMFSYRLSGKERWVSVNHAKDIGEAEAFIDTMYG